MPPYVLMLCSWYPGRADALSGDFVQRHARALATQMRVITVFAGKYAINNRAGILVEKAETNNLTEYRCYYPPRLFLGSMRAQWDYLVSIRRVLKEVLSTYGPPTLVHIQVGWKGAIWAWYLRHFYRQWPQVVTEHSTEYHANATLNIRNQPWMRQYLTRTLFKHTRLWMPVSAHLGDTLAQYFGLQKPVCVVPNTVDTSLFYPAPPASALVPFRVLHVSTFTTQKNPEALLRIFTRLLALKMEVWIIGTESELLYKWYNNLTTNLKEQVKCLGYCTYMQVADAMRQCHSLLLFSRYENLPCVILEAFCCGLPVVSTRVGGIAEVVNEQNGVLVADGDEDGAVQALAQMAAGDLHFDNQQIARQAQKLYSYAAIGRQIMDGYAQTGLI